MYRHPAVPQDIGITAQGYVSGKCMTAASSAFKMIRPVGAAAYELQPHRLGISVIHPTAPRDIGLTAYGYIGAPCTAMSAEKCEYRLLGDKDDTEFSSVWTVDILLSQ